MKRLVRQKGFEPLAYCLEGSCSIQLCYTCIPSMEIISSNRIA